jgi:hypothetical protein
MTDTSHEETAPLRFVRSCSDPRGTRSPHLAHFGLSPGPTRTEKERRDAIYADLGLLEKYAWRRNLAPWMLRPCPQGEIPCECLCGVDACVDAKFCVMKRLAEYAKGGKSTLSISEPLEVVL